MDYYLKKYTVHIHTSWKLSNQTMGFSCKFEKVVNLRTTVKCVNVVIRLLFTDSYKANAFGDITLSAMYRLTFSVTSSALEFFVNVTLMSLTLMVNTRTF